MGKLNWHTEPSESFNVDRLNVNRLIGYPCHDVRTDVNTSSPYRAVNTLRLGYKNQSVNVV
jgi:hypothetical protein